MNIYVGNLSYDTTEDDLRSLFEAYGQVTSATLVKDKFSGRSRGFGFVEMASAEEGQAAIAGLNGSEVSGRTLTVNEARPREERGGYGGGGGRGGGQRGGYGGGGGQRGGGRRDDRRGGGKRRDWDR